jgi:alpha-ketoglutarate-dependent taurine dioxygenase
MRQASLTAGGTTLVVFDATVIPLGELRPRIDDVLHTCGAALLRGLGIGTPEQFHAVVREFGEPLGSYRGGNTPRTLVTDGVFTSTEYPPEYDISLHNELSYAARWPDRLYFCCLVPAETGGATPVCDGRALLADLDPAVRERFNTRGVTYRQYLHGGFGLGKSWQQTFQTDDRAEAESFLRDADIDFEWTDDDGLRTAQHRPATREHPVTGQTVWFNQADQWHPSTLPPAEAESLLALIQAGEEPPHLATYGDGEQLSTADLDQVRLAAKKHELSFQWQRGDLLIVDNMLMLHGRHPYTGPRRILVSMT